MRYRLSSDSNNIILQEKFTVQGNRELTKSKVGDEYWLNVAYYGDPTEALHGILKREIYENWVEDLKEVSRRFDQIEKDLIALHPVLDTFKSKSSPIEVESNDNIPLRNNSPLITRQRKPRSDIGKKRK